MEKLPSMPFFTGDYLASADVLMMTLAERGLYTHLLFRTWQDGRLKFDAKKLSVLCGCTAEEFTEIWPGIADKFKTDTEGRIYNAKVEAVRKKCVAIKKSRSEAGSKGGSVASSKQHSKTPSKSDSKTPDKTVPPVYSSLVYSKPVQKKLKNTSSRADKSALPKSAWRAVFEEQFWPKVHWQRRIDKKKCLAEWVRLFPKNGKAEELAGKICTEATDYYLNNSNKPQFLKHPLRFLNGRLWEDRPKPQQPPQPKEDHERFCKHCGYSAYQHKTLMDSSMTILESATQGKHKPCQEFKEDGK